jgi:hypothetical protein
MASKLKQVSDMSKIRIWSFNVVILGLIVAGGGLRANTMTTYSDNPYNINMDLSQPYNYGDNVVTRRTNYMRVVINNSNTNSYDYSNYEMSTFQNNNLCVKGLCEPSYTNFNITVPTTTGYTIINNLHLLGYNGENFRLGYNTMINAGARGQSGGLPLGALDPPGPPLTVLPIGTTVTLPGLVVQPSTISTVTTNIPTIQVMTNFNTMPIVLDLADDPEPSTVLLLVSGMVAFGILYQKRLKIRPH